MLIKTHKGALRDLFAKHGLYMPMSISAQQAIADFIQGTRYTCLNDLSPEERIFRLKTEHEKWKDKVVRHKGESGPLRLLRVSHVLPKKKGEIEKQIRDRSGGVLITVEELSYFKACVRSAARYRYPWTIPLEMLVVWDG